VTTRTVGSGRSSTIRKPRTKRSAASARLYHFGAEHFTAETRVLFRLFSALVMVHVQGADPVAERPERVPEAGRVGSARDQAEHLAAGLDQVLGADQLLDSLAEL
jgi:hypothetical protein